MSALPPIQVSPMLNQDSDKSQPWLKIYRKSSFFKRELLFFRQLLNEKATFLKDKESRDKVKLISEELNSLELKFQQILNVKISEEELSNEMPASQRLCLNMWIARLEEFERDWSRLKWRIMDVAMNIFQISFV